MKCNCVSETGARENKTHMNIKCFLVCNLFPSVELSKIYSMLIFVFVTSSQTKIMTIKHNTTYTTMLNIDKWRDSLREQYITSEALPPSLILKAELQRQWFQKLMRMLC